MRVGWTPLTSHLLPVLSQPVQRLTPFLSCLRNPFPLHCPPTGRSGGRSCGSHVGTCCPHWCRSTSCSHSGSSRTRRRRRTPRRTRPHSIDGPRTPTGTASRRSTGPTRATRRRPTASSSCHSSARFISSHSTPTCSLLFRVRLLSFSLLFLWTQDRRLEIRLWRMARVSALLSTRPERTGSQHLQVEGLNVC